MIYGSDSDIIAFFRPHKFDSLHVAPILVDARYDFVFETHGRQSHVEDIRSASCHECTSQSFLPKTRVNLANRKLVGSSYIN